MATHFHYTSVLGLQGIITSEELRLNNVFQIDKDQTEVKWLCSIAIDYVLQRKDGIGKEWVCEEDSEGQLVKYLNCLGRHLLSYRNFIFCSCFTKEFDSDFHWTNYGDAGCGVAIGCDLDSIKAANQQSSALMTQPIEYEEIVQRSEVKRIVERFSDTPNQQQGLPHSGESAEFRAFQTLTFLSRIAPICKAPKYKLDNEVRLLLQPTLESSFDVNDPARFFTQGFPGIARGFLLKKGNSAKYAPIRMPIHAVTHVALGPNYDATDSPIDVEKFLSARGIHAVSASPA